MNTNKKEANLMSNRKEAKSSGWGGWGCTIFLIIVAAIVLFFIFRKEDPRKNAEPSYLHDWAFIPSSGNIYAAMKQSNNSRTDGALFTLLEYDPLADTILSNTLIQGRFYLDYVDIFPSGDGVCVFAERDDPDYTSYIYYYESGFAEPKLVSDRYFISDIFITRDRLASRAVKLESLQEHILFIEEDSLQAFDLGTTGDLKTYYEKRQFRGSTEFDMTNVEIPLIIDVAKDEKTAHIIGLFPDRAGKLPIYKTELEGDKYSIKQTTPEQRREIAAYFGRILPDETCFNVWQKKPPFGTHQLYTYPTSALRDIEIGYHRENLELSFDTSQYVLRLPQLSFNSDHHLYSSAIICSNGDNESIVFGTQGQLTAYRIEHEPFAVANLTGLLDSIQSLPRKDISEAMVRDNRLMINFATNTRGWYDWEDWNNLACYAVDLDGGRPVRLTGLELEDACAVFWKASLFRRLMNPSLDGWDLGVLNLIAGGRGVWLLLLLLSVLLPLFFSARWFIRIRKRGEFAEATVVGFEGDDDEYEEMKYFRPRFEFDLHGKKHTALSAAPSTYRRKKYEVGDRVSIHYMPDEPDRPLADDEPFDWKLVAFCLLAIAGFIGVGLLLGVFNFS